VDENNLLELIKQMSESDSIYNEKEGYSTNEGSPSWNAFRKAEQLTDTTVIPFLKNLLEKSKDRETRENIYFTFGKIGVNTGDKRVVDILLKRLEVETNKYTLEMILDRIAEQEDVSDGLPIIKCINDNRWQVRYSAIEALGKCKSPAAEDALIKVITESQDENDLRYAICSLCDMSATKSIPYLLPLVKHTKADVRRAAIGALDELGDSSFLPFFIEAMEDRSPSVKYYALLALLNHGDETTIEVVYKRVKTFLSRKRKIESDELVPAFEFLNRYKEHHKKIQELFEWIKSKKWDYLFDEEKDWYKKNIN
jgi:HEAT repeat protein